MNTKLRISTLQNRETGLILTGLISAQRISGNIDLKERSTIQIDTADLSWNGTSSFVFKPEVSLRSLEAKGTFSSANASVIISDPETRLKHKGLKWNGSISIEDLFDMIASDLSGDIDVEDLRVSGPGGELDIDSMFRLSKTDEGDLHVEQSGTISGTHLNGEFGLFEERDLEIPDVDLSAISELPKRPCSWMTWYLIHRVLFYTVRNLAGICSGILRSPTVK